MTAAYLKYMNNIFTVSFFYKGERIDIEGYCDHWPKNDLDASGIAFLAIKSWFENEKLAKPDVVRNVDLVAKEKSYHWDKVIL